jgi:hypothetical protein
MSTYFNTTMSSFSIQKAALEGQPGLVRSLLAEDAKLINAKDDVSFGSNSDALLLGPACARALTSNEAPA